MREKCLTRLGVDADDAQLLGDDVDELESGETLQRGPDLGIEL